MYRLHIDDRNYESFSVYDSTNMDKVELPDFNPLTHHLFSNDLFSLSSTNEVELLHSNVRNYEYISGVLVLENDTNFLQKLRRLTKGRIKLLCRSFLRRFRKH